MSNKSMLVVDYGIAPSLIDLWVKAHPKREDIVKYDLSNIECVLTLKSGESRISGNENLKRLKDTGKILLDVRVLEELLKHPELISEEWKKGVTYFWGTIFCGSSGSLYVAYLRWDGDGWRWHYDWLDDDWGDDSLAACLGK